MEQRQHEKHPQHVAPSYARYTFKKHDCGVLCFFIIIKYEDQIKLIIISSK